MMVCLVAKQRLEIARALYHDSQLILADEIKTNLDSENSRKISDLLFSLPQTVIEVIPPLHGRRLKTL